MVQFDFADVTGNSVLEHSIHFLQLLSTGNCFAANKPSIKRRSEKAF